MGKYLYMHSGSQNHGCEAIVRSTYKIINDQQLFKLFSAQKNEDSQYEIDRICEIQPQGKIIKRFTLKHIFFKLHLAMQHKKNYYYHLYHNLLCDIKANDIYFSIGGDNYCYDGYPETLSFLNRKINSCSAKTVLWGCSITPELLKNPAIVEDLKHYALITPRESITYKALLVAGVNKNTKLFSDPAFTLDTVKLDLPYGFAANNTIGINVSPLIINCENNTGATMKNYTALIQHIIDTTDMQIALIPHVVWETNDDRKPLRELYQKFSSTGRVVMIEDHNCMELKGFIARCRMFIGARTHATIAAYSSSVPTLVVGYSVKAKGIAQDIFGTYDNYVIPVQSLADKADLINAFEWLKRHEQDISEHLQAFMPAYIAKAYEAGKEVKKLIE